MNSVVLRCSAPLRTVGECSTITAVPPEMSERSAQTLAMLVKAVDRVPVLGRVPSGMRQAAQEEWLQDLHSPRGRRRQTWQSVLTAVRCSWYRKFASCTWLSRYPHSRTCTECGYHQSGGLACDAGYQARTTVRDDRFQRFHRVLTQMHMQQADMAKAQPSATAARELCDFKV